MGVVERSGVNVRRVKRSDIDAILALDGKVSGGQSRLTYKDMVAADPGGALDMSFVADIEDKVIGFILAKLAYQGMPFSEICLILAIDIDDAYKQLGIGRSLVYAVLEHCHAEGVNTVRAIFSEHDAKLRRFVENMGFHRSVIVNYDKTFES